VSDIKLSEIQAKLAKSLNSAHTNLELPFGFYWTRKSPSIAKSLIENFSSANSVILDPFLGSGTTGIGSLSAGDRLFVGVEVNELPIANLMFTIKPHIRNFEKEILSIKEILDKSSEMYRFTLQDHVFEISKVIFDLKDGVLSPIMFEGSIDGSKLTKISAGHDFFELALETYFSTVKANPTREVKILAENSRIAIARGMTTSDPFSPLNFETLYQMRELAKTNKTAQLLLASCLHLCRLTDSKSQSQFPYWKPKNSIHEKAAPLILSKYLSKLVERANSLFTTIDLNVYEKFEDWSGQKNNGTLLIKGATQTALKNSIPDESVDLVLTDPPYFDQVAYSEYLKLYEYYTHFTSELDNEIVQSSRTGAGKTREVFLQELGAAFSETRRVMKNNTLALVYFKDSKPRNLHDFISTLEGIGLSFQTQVHLAKNTYTYKQNASKESTVGGDSIMVFQASLPSKSHSNKSLSKPESEQLFIAMFQEYLSENGPSSLTEALDNGLIAKLYRSGALSSVGDSSFFFDCASKQFSYDESTRKWSLIK
jgi:DNA modification methylase